MIKFAILLLNILMSMSGHFFFKLGINQIHEYKSTLDFLIKAFTNTSVMFGLMLFIFSAVTWFLTLQKFPLSVAYPALSIGYVIILFLSWRFMGESITTAKIFGTLFILIGVTLLFSSN